MRRLFNSCRFSHGPPSDQQQQATFRKRFVIEARHNDRPSCSWCANWVIYLAVRPADEERSRSRSQNSWRNPKILALVHIRGLILMAKKIAREIARESTRVRSKTHAISQEDCDSEGI